MRVLQLNITVELNIIIVSTKILLMLGKHLSSIQDEQLAATQKVRKE